MFAAVAVLVLGCGRDDRPPTPGSGAAVTRVDGAATPEKARGEPLRAQSNAGSFTIEVTPLCAAIPMNEQFGVELALFRADGTTPYEPEEVTLDARMEEHEHGMLRDVALAPIGPGRWRADGLLFHMVGVWQFQIDVREGAHIERAQLDLELE
jgi:hypothetical protein